METSKMLTKYSDSVVVIPAYQPSENLIGLVHALSGSGYSVIVVDDGSKCDYSHIFQELDHNAIIIHHLENLGKGAALKTAFSFISDYMPKAGCIITMDADGQHLPQDMEHVALCAWTHPGTLALGSRNFDEDIPLRSKLGNKITRFVFSFVAKTKVQDTQTGLRAFDRSLLDYMIDMEGDRYEYEMNVLLHCKQCGIPIEEVPIQTVYLDKENSSSHFDGFRDSLRIYKNIMKFASASLVSFLADYLMFLLLTIIFPAGAVFLLMSNILARIGSAALNYTLNTKAVFHDHRPATQTLPQYALLAASILAANSLLLTLLTSVAGIPVMAAKIMTEIILFVLSFFVQSKLIFKPEADMRGGAHHAVRTAAHGKIA
ncbi:MAG: glycosyltransferase [Petrimonas sp.]|nr:glycosyltransferase [Petrimonas sp.]